MAKKHFNISTIENKNTFNLDAEISVLSTLIYSNDKDLTKKVFAIVEAEHFYDAEHQKVFSTIQKLIENDKPIDLVSVFNTAKVSIDKSVIEILHEQARYAPKSTIYHAEIVRKKYIIRKTLELAESIVNSTTSDDVEVIRETFEEAFYEFKEESKISEFIKTPKTFEEWESYEVKPLEHILEPIIQTNNQIVVHAATGVGKTHFIRELAYAIATGDSAFNGKWKAQKKRKVLIIDGEIPEAELKEDFIAMRKWKGKSTNGNLFIQSFMDSPNDDIDLIKPKWRNYFTDLIERLNIEVVIFDNVDSLFNLDQCKQVEWTPAKLWLKRLRGNGITSIIVHHSNKQGESFGTTSLTRQPNLVMALVRPEGYMQEEGAVFNVFYEKGRKLKGESAASFQCKLTPNGWETGESPLSMSGIEKAIIESIEDGNTHYKDIAQDLGKGIPNMKSRLSMMAKKRLIERTTKPGEYKNI